jgi:hypothetical protein
MGINRVPDQLLLEVVEIVEREDKSAPFGVYYLPLTKQRAAGSFLY